MICRQVALLRNQGGLCYQLLQHYKKEMEALQRELKVLQTQLPKSSEDLEAKTKQYNRLYQPAEQYWLDDK